MKSIARTAVLCCSLFLDKSLVCQHPESCTILSSIEGEPSARVNYTVDAISGQYIEEEVDYILTGPEPVLIRRMLASGDAPCYANCKPVIGNQAGWEYNSYIKLIMRCESQSYGHQPQDNQCRYVVEVADPYGTTMHYHGTLNHPEAWRDLKLTLDPACYERGLTNTATGELSGRTNLKNSYVVINSLDGNHVCVVSGDGTKRFYRFHKTDHIDVIGSPENEKMHNYDRFIDEQKQYLLSFEIRPNGRVIRYHFTASGKLSNIRVENASGSKVFSSVNFHYNLYKDDILFNPRNCFFQALSNTGRSIIYQVTCVKQDGEHYFHLDSVAGSHLPDTAYSYGGKLKKNFIPLWEKPQSIKKRVRPDGRFLLTEYYSGTKRQTFQVGDRHIKLCPNLRNRVAMQKAPLGDDASPIPLARFYYHFNRNSHPRWGGHTEVYDAHDQRTVYHYSEDQLLYAVERFDSAGNLLSTERLSWGANGTKDASLLIAHSWSDGDGNAYAAKTFTYDERGNVLEEKMWGNLSGHSVPLSLHPFQAIPIENGVECEAKTFTYSSDGFNLLLSAAESNGKSTVFSYLPGTNLLAAKLICENGQIRLRYFYEYDEDAVMVRAIHDDGTSADKNNLQNVTERHFILISTRQTAPGIAQPEMIEEKYLDDGKEVLLKKTFLTYASNDLVVKKEIFDAEGALCCSFDFDYDAKDRLVRERDLLGNEKRYQYDANNNLVLVQGPCLDVLTKKTYDLMNRLVCSEEKHSDGSIYTTRYTYDYLGNQTSIEDPYGNVTRNEYDAFGRVAKTTGPPIFAGNHILQPVVQKTYDLFGHIVEETDPNGFATKTRCTIKGKPFEILYPDGSKESFLYHLDGRLQKSTAKNGSYTIYHYDYLGRVLSTETYSSSHQLLEKISAAYNAFHQTSSTDGEGFTTFYTYDKAGRLASVIKNEARSTYSYDAMGNQRGVKTWFGQDSCDFTASFTERDIEGKVIEERLEDSSGKILKKTCYLYDNVGNRVQTTQFLSPSETAVTSIEYNSRNQPIRITNPMGRCTSIQYNDHFVNSFGQRVLQKTETDPLGNQIITTFDAHGHPATIIRKNLIGNLLAETACQYDAAGNTTRQTDTVICPNAANRSMTTAWFYGPLNRLEKEIEAFNEPLQRETCFIYDSTGKLREKSTPGGTRLYHEYDAQGRLASFYSLNSSEPISYSYQYDRNHRVTEITDAIQGQTIRRSYDPQGNLIKETLDGHPAIEATYDSAGRRTTLLIPQGGCIQFTYKAVHLYSVKLLSPAKQERYLHTYTKRDLRGLPLEAFTPADTIYYHWDALGRSMGISSACWKETIPSDGYDAAGNLCKSFIEDSAGRIDYSFCYNDLYQLEQEQGAFSHAFVTDSLHNRIVSDEQYCQYNALNQLISDGCAYYAYDLCGNLILKTAGTSQIHYRYDALNRLIEAVQEGHLSVRFSYDALNRRVAKKTFQWDATSQCWKLLAQLRFLHDGQNEIGSTDSSGRIVELRVLGEGMGAEISSAIAIELDNILYTPLHDHRGALTALISPQTNILAECYRYSAFGEEQIFNGAGEQLNESTLGNPWRFSSKRIDEETGLVYFGRRYYNPAAGRWITTDPQGYIDGANLYAYLNHNPLNSIDLFGLASFKDNGADFFRSCSRIGDTIRSCFEQGVKTLSQAIETAGRHTGLFPLVTLGRAMRGDINKPCYFTEYSRNFTVGHGEISPKVRVSFQNGINTSYREACKAAQYVSNAFGRVNVHASHNASRGTLFDLFECLLNKFGIATPPVYRMVENFRNLIASMGGVGRGGIIKHCAHSQGGLITRLALQRLSLAERKMIEVFTFGSASIIPASMGKNVHNFIAARDPVPLTDPVGLIGGLSSKNSNLKMIGSWTNVPFIDHSIQGKTYGSAIKDIGRKFQHDYGGLTP